MRERIVKRTQRVPMVAKVPGRREGILRERRVVAIKAVELIVARATTLGTSGAPLRVGRPITSAIPMMEYRTHIVPRAGRILLEREMVGVPLIRPSITRRPRSQTDLSILLLRLILRTG